MTNLDQAVILVTGANGGFGQEFTRQLLLSNSYLILSDLPKQGLREGDWDRKGASLAPLQMALFSADRVSPISDSAQTNKGKILAYFPSDLATPEGCQQLYDQVQTLNTPIDIGPCVLSMLKIEKSLTARFLNQLLTV